MAAPPTMTTSAEGVTLEFRLFMTMRHDRAGWSAFQVASVTTRMPQPPRRSARARIRPAARPGTRRPRDGRASAPGARASSSGGFRSPVEHDHEAAAGEFVLDQEPRHHGRAQSGDGGLRHHRELLEARPRDRPSPPAGRPPPAIRPRRAGVSTAAEAHAQQVGRRLDPRGADQVRARHGTIVSPINGCRSAPGQCRSPKWIAASRPSSAKSNGTIGWRS